MSQDLAASAYYERELALHVGGGGDAAPLSDARTLQGGDSRRATEKGVRQIRCSEPHAPCREERGVRAAKDERLDAQDPLHLRGVGEGESGEAYPQLYVGTSRCSILQLGGRGGGEELIAGHFDEATGVAAHPLDSAVWASCGADRQLLLWHRSSPTPTQRTSLRAAASCLTFSPDAKLLAVGHADGTVSLVTAHPPLAHRQLHLAHCRTRVEAVAFSPDGVLLACAGHDRLVEISLVAPSPSAVPAPPRLVPLFVCRGHTASVLHLDWSADSRLLMSDCAAHEILCWAVPRQQPIAAAKPATCRVLKPATQAARLLADSSWASWTCVLGFPVMGIWPDDSDGTDVNAVHRSAGGGLVLTADDFGEVKLFNSPCVVEDAPFHVGTGHSSHVSCVRFLEGDFAAVSAGSKDRAVIVWQLEKAPEPDRLNPEPILLPDMPRRGFLLAAQPPPPTKGKF
ncbi:hypothetical protein AB1Y20_011577 [Prymnesium parvum]|uniref:EML-like second beta-propeller domain-containing protein n=1 Tax=Prymnesium parvum TaxID=97485 RepID=A0AB34IIZ5_PRYPA